jgi:photosystem II stability/assembly factor-like uncharacterized protein
MKKIIFTVFIFYLTLLATNAQWYPQVSGTNQNLYDIEFLNINTGWAVGDGGVIIKTTNSGINWVNVPNPAVGKPLSAVNILDSNNVYVVGWFETIIKTTNGGLNWIEIKNGPWGQGNSYDGCYFLDSKYGFVVGRTQMVWKTTDGGLNFTGGYLSGSFYDVYFKNYNNGILSGSVVDSYKTTNGGINWNLMSFPFGFIGSVFYRISVVNDNCWFIGDDRRMFYSFNFGISWDSISRIPYISPTGWIFCSSFSDSLIGWVAGEYNRLFKTTDGGYNWARENTGAGVWFWKDLYSYNDSVIWGVGGGGRIMHTTNGGQTLVNITKSIISLPKNFKLYQNYPNPFNSETIINFDINKDGKTKLIVYDILGREIAILVDDFLNQGIHKVKFNIESIKQKSSSGIYFYSLYFNNQLIDTKKLIYIP